MRKVGNVVTLRPRDGQNRVLSSYLVWPDIDTLLSRAPFEIHREDGQGRRPKLRLHTFASAISAEDVVPQLLELGYEPEDIWQAWKYWQGHRRWYPAVPMVAPFHHVVDDDGSWLFPCIETDGTLRCVVVYPCAAYMFGPEWAFIVSPKLESVPKSDPVP